MTKATHTASAADDITVLKGAIFIGASAKLYVGAKANNVRIQFDGETASAQQWAGESSADVQSFDITSASKAIELINECRMAAGSENGQIKVPAGNALIHFKVDGEEHTLDLARNGARFYTALQFMADEEKQSSTQLAASLEKGSQVEASVDEQAAQLKGALKQATNVTATSPAVKGQVQEMSAEPEPAEADYPTHEHEILGMHDEGDEHGWNFADGKSKPKVVDRFAFPEGTIFNGELLINLPNGGGSEVYAFDADEGSVEITVTIPATGDDEGEDGREIVIDSLTQEGAANRLIELVQLHEGAVEAQMIEPLDLHVPALELEYSYHPEKKGKVTLAKRRELGEMFVTDIQALAVPVKAEVSLFDQTEFTYEEFEHVAKVYSQKLAARCAESSPAEVLAPVLKLTGWISTIDEAGDSESFMLDGSTAVDGLGQLMRLGTALERILAADKITFLPDSRLASFVTSPEYQAKSKVKGMDMKMLTGVLAQVAKEDDQLIHTVTGFKSLISRIHTEATASLAVEVGKVNTLIDSDLSVIASELLVDVNSK